MKTALPLASSKVSKPLSGTVRVPGDKSMSHRALMFGALTREETMISGLLEGEDVMNTADAVRAMGAKIAAGDDGLWRVHGAGLGHLTEPTQVIDMGNSGTSTRLLAGIVAGHPIAATFTGDASLNKRPMGRVIEPLTQMGAQFLARGGKFLPLTMRGADAVKAIEYKLPVPSAQVKSALLLAGLNANGTTTVIEDRPTRDHTENMLRHFGVDVQVEKTPTGASIIRINGGQMLRGCAIDIPADPSSAAFPTAAAVLVEGSELKLPRIGINPRRIGFYDTLRDMGADIQFQNVRTEGGEAVADIVVRGIGALKGITVPPERVSDMIDECPILAVVASCANGTTYMTGLAELRVKESDRLQRMADGLAACGVKLETGAESLTIHGTGKPPKGGAFVETSLDHRIAMSFLVLGMVADETITIDDSRPIATSFPKFTDLMNGIGASFGAGELCLDDLALRKKRI
jgi:3-phosphoshikimate 1-carboxyvinyltransferase